jgi:tRNA (guanine37-N1)-methyltransferase
VQKSRLSAKQEARCKRNLHIDILSLFPGYFQGPFDESIIKQARKKGLVTINLTDMRDFADNRYRRVDDRPYGGGPGMVLMPQPVTVAIRHVRTPNAHVVYLSPQGTPLKAAKCRQLAQETHLVLLCGHYEGIDQRVLESEVDEEISIGDYVLTNGCLAAIVLVDSVLRFIPGVLGHELAAEEDSFEKQLLDFPHYTRPEVFEGREVPPVLLSGHHQEIAEWRREQALKKTREVRPDLLR